MATLASRVDRRSDVSLCQGMSLSRGSGVGRDRSIKVAIEAIDARSGATLPRLATDLGWSGHCSNLDPRTSTCYQGQGVLTWGVVSVGDIASVRTNPFREGMKSLRRYLSLCGFFVTFRSKWGHSSRLVSRGDCFTIEVHTRTATSLQWGYEDLIFVNWPVAIIFDCPKNKYPFSLQTRCRVPTRFKCCYVELKSLSSIS